MRITDVTPDRGTLGRDLLAMQHAAYAVEAKLIEDDRIPRCTRPLRTCARSG
ncbi:hypothetical protein ACFQX6_14835 [Streptosporangium lutulentum]